MKLIVGLGNPGIEYERTRHNVGFGFINFVTNNLGLTFNTKFHSEVAEYFLGDKKFMFVKPQTFMNDSGIAVSEIMNFYKLNPEDVYIAFDDLDIKEGEYKIQTNKYPKVHNGINDILEQTGKENFNFIRIGIDGRSDEERKNIAGRDYVLGRSAFDYEKLFEEILKVISSRF